MEGEGDQGGREKGVGSHQQSRTLFPVGWRWLLSCAQNAGGQDTHVVCVGRRGTCWTGTGPGRSRVPRPEEALVTVSVYVCVCVWEGGRERERECVCVDRKSGV